MFFKKKKKDKGPGYWKRELRSIFLIILGVMAFRSTFFEPFRIPSGSMIPTLMIGDFILVNKFSYGFKLPFSQFFGDPVYLTGPHEPARGDVIVFKFPRDESFNYIKRLVGKPGDEIEVINKKVFVNGKAIDVQEVAAKEFMDDMDDKYKNYNFKFLKSKTGEAEHIIQLNEDAQLYTEFNKIIVPKDHYFVMGDNRDFSSDSRFWGFVPFKNVKGKAIAVWFSMILPFDAGQDFKFRPWRIGTLIN